MRRLAILAVFLAAGLGAGFAMAWLVLGVSELVLGPFRPEDDDTVRERVPVALAYIAWATTASGLGFVGWRAARRAG